MFGNSQHRPGDSWDPIAVALCQFRASSSAAENRNAILAQIDQVADAGADLAVFPELATIDPIASNHDWFAAAEAIDGPFIAAIRDRAHSRRVAVVVGILEASPSGGLPYNTAVAVDRDGSLAGAYRKIHLYDALGVRESDRTAAGDPSPLAVMLAGVPCGLMTCYDLRFPELARSLSTVGAEVLIVPAAWHGGPKKARQWATLTQSRALENTVFVVAVDQASPTFVGESAAIDPTGDLLAELGARNDWVIATLDRQALTDYRSVMPSLSHRRL